MKDFKETYRKYFNNDDDYFSFLSEILYIFMYDKNAQEITFWDYFNPKEKGKTYLSMDKSKKRIAVLFFVNEENKYKKITVHY